MGYLLLAIVSFTQAVHRLFIGRSPHFLLVVACLRAAEECAGTHAEGAGRLSGCAGLPEHRLSQCLLMSPCLLT